MILELQREMSRVQMSSTEMSYNFKYMPDNYKRTDISQNAQYDKGVSTKTQCELETNDDVVVHLVCWPQRGEGFLHTVNSPVYPCQPEPAAENSRSERGRGRGEKQKVWQVVEAHLELS